MRIGKHITKWEAPEGGGAPLITMPNIPHPLHLLNPRSIMGSYEWGKVRKQCYEDAGDICEICGTKLASKRTPGVPLHEAHELYDYDFKTYTATFVRPIALCGTCHRGIHSGRAMTCYEKHEPLWTPEFMESIARNAFELVHNWNKLHPDEEPLRLFEAFLSWREDPTLQVMIDRLIDEYEIEFYNIPNASEWQNAWGKWKLIYNGTEYYSPYQSREEWEEATKSQHDEGKNLFDEKQMEELSKLEDDIWQQ